MFLKHRYTKVSSFQASIILFIFHNTFYMLHLIEMLNSGQSLISKPLKKQLDLIIYYMQTNHCLVQWFPKCGMHTPGVY